MYIRRNKPVIIALLLSFLVVGLAYWYTHRATDASKMEATADANELSNAKIDALPGLTETDHILGNPAADMIFIVYSDFVCPYCKEYHQTLRNLMKLFGTSGKIAIVFRHMPFVQLHPEAPMYALASECVAQEAGNAGFWKFTDNLFAVSDPLNPLSAGEVVVIAEKSGATRQKFVACMRSNELMPLIEGQFTSVIEAGVKGSPFTIVDDINGRVSYEGTRSLRILAETIQASLRITSVEDLASPSENNSFIADFDALDIVATSTGTTTTQASSTPGTPASSTSI